MMLLGSRASATSDGALGADRPHKDEFRIQAKLPGHGGSFVRFSADGSLLLTAGEKELQIWDAKTFAPVGQALAFPEEFVTAGFTDGGRVAFVAHSEGLWLWDARTGKRIGP